MMQVSVSKDNGEPMLQSTTVVAVEATTLDSPSAATDVVRRFHHHVASAKPGETVVLIVTVAK